jgi:hypothetical protein
MIFFFASKLLCVIGGGLATGQAFKSIKEGNVFYAGFLLFTAIANLVLLGRY